MNLANTSGTKCPKCENSNFELSEDFPTESAFRFYYIRCSSCKTFLQALPFHDTNTLLGKIIKFFKIP
jgi:predicted nucleic-acid-binding Zn-ribbon protein